jgi:hypothetical protein
MTHYQLQATTPMVDYGLANNDKQHQDEEQIIGNNN